MCVDLKGYTVNRRAVFALCVELAATFAHMVCSMCYGVAFCVRQTADTCHPISDIKKRLSSFGVAGRPSNNDKTHRSNPHSSPPFPTTRLWNWRTKQILWLLTHCRVHVHSCFSRKHTTSDAPIMVGENALRHYMPRPNTCSQLPGWLILGAKPEWVK